MFSRQPVIKAVIKLLTLPAGFSALFGSASGLWGQGTYFSTLFGFATTYSYKLTGSAASPYVADGAHNVRQILVADVLTGHYKTLPSNDKLRGPPEIEDADVVRWGLHGICCSQIDLLGVCFPNAHAANGFAI